MLRQGLRYWLPAVHALLFEATCTMLGYRPRTTRLAETRQSCQHGPEVTGCTRMQAVSGVVDSSAGTLVGLLRSHPPARLLLLLYLLGIHLFIYLLIGRLQRQVLHQVEGPPLMRT